MDENDYRSYLLALPFFNGIDTAQAERTVSKMRDLTSVKEYHAGDTVDGGRAVCVILSGEADISVSLSNDAVIRTVSAGDMFGAGMVYGCVPPETSAVARTRTRVLFISRDALDVMIAESPAAAKNYIAMLSDKIAFLNRRIAMFTATDAAEKVALYLYGCAADGGSFSDTVRLSDPYTAIAKKLDIGRASLYRTLDNFVDAGLIRRDGNVITIPDPDALLRINKHQ